MSLGAAIGQHDGTSRVVGYQAAHLNNNYLQDVNGSFVLQGPTGTQTKSSLPASKQAALKKKHFQFQQSQFESMLN